ncbi:MAG TPA: hypothetical protein VJZ06_00940 [Mobilitalea sp.]|nr:hypothetical protein [Mobilitalea sp.]
METVENIFGRNVVEKALLYANHEWYATEKNVLHGMDTNGIFVDTPDISWHGEVLDCGWWKVNQKNKGVPYGWGNASTLEEFDNGIAEGKYAGNVPEDKTRYRSWFSIGVDCSGLLTVCWDLPKKIVARDIPNIAECIEFEEIMQGDVFAISSHVMLFKEFLDVEKTMVKIIDSTRSTGRVSERDFLVGDLFSQGYKIYRKR